MKFSKIYLNVCVYRVVGYVEINNLLLFYLYKIRKKLYNY